MRKLHLLLLALATSTGKPHGVRIQSAIDSKITFALKQWISLGSFLEKDSSIESLAEAINVEKSQLQYYFRSIVKKRFSTWQKELRIGEAKRLLIENPDMPVSAVGAAVGICDKSNFRKRFFEVEGCSPLEWRKKKLGK